MLLKKRLQHYIQLATAAARLLLSDSINLCNDQLLLREMQQCSFLFLMIRPERNNSTARKCRPDCNVALPFLLRGLLGARLFSDGNVELFFCRIYELIQHYAAQLFVL